MTNTHLCNWARDGALHYTFGVYNFPLPEVEQSGCLVLWGSDPTATLLSLATRIVAARSKGMRLVVVDPRRVGLANKADVLLQVRPGTDGALALALIDVLIQEGLFDERFVREWTNAPLLVREDTGRLVQTSNLAPGTFVAGPHGEGARYAALDGNGRVVEYVAGVGEYAVPASTLALRGRAELRTRDGKAVRCRTVFDLLAEEARRLGAKRATLEVRASNDGALRMYERLGFYVAATRRNYYTNPVEDALILWRDEGSAHPERTPSSG
jgi:anaerobic selenocysteine-containing dehydrogenase